MSFCEMTVGGDGAVTVGRWEVIDLLDGDTQSANKVKMESLHQRLECFLVRYFPSGPTAQQFDCVGIELQPQGRLTNLRMHIAAHVAYSYFRTMLHLNAKLVSVRFIAACKKYPSKLMAACGLTAARAYKVRKKNSIALCRHLTTGLPGRGKLDDLADSFLIARACI
jgi:hypothetical protein